jgi:hypothetical protein
MSALRISGNAAADRSDGRQGIIGRNMESGTSDDDAPTCVRCGRKMKRLHIPAASGMSVYKCPVCETIKTIKVS